ncbi:MAG TPA: TatD family hydrolase [Candidatus Bilamarchaeum sp.]|nr:TatD family hydrolase [Candidatus Bilamarchaeum sp.]
MFVDSHSHLFDLKDYQLPEDIYPVIIGYSHGSNRKAAELAKAKGYPFALGIAPQTTVKHGTKDAQEWVEFIRAARPNAIGEVGLDYKWAENTGHVDGEKMVFRMMIELADELKVPLVIHSRNNPNENEVPKDAIEDIIGMVAGRGVLMHFYSGGEEQAMRIVDAGGYISIMHLRSKDRRKVINSVPLDRLMIESDSPYVGRTPDTIREAAAYIAEIKGIGVEEAAKATAENAMRFFGFKI